MTREGTKCATGQDNCGNKQKRCDHKEHDAGHLFRLDVAVVPDDLALCGAVALAGSGLKLGVELAQAHEIITTRLAGLVDGRTEATHVDLERGTWHPRQSAGLQLLDAALGARVEGAALDGYVGGSLADDRVAAGEEPAAAREQVLDDGALGDDRGRRGDVALEVLEGSVKVHPGLDLGEPHDDRGGQRGGGHEREESCRGTVLVALHLGLDCGDVFEDVGDASF